MFVASEGVDSEVVNNIHLWCGIAAAIQEINQTCIRARRVDVSNAFFFEQEYQQTGSYVFRLYRAAFGNNQAFPNPDNSNQTGGVARAKCKVARVSFSFIHLKSDCGLDNICACHV
ncbi:MAG: hypothetical protein M3R52_11650 [Acidobacteriota bacterium]|nr:hypothetical protein [Acidobacteriota bacterium]